MVHLSVSFSKIFSQCQQCPNQHKGDEYKYGQACGLRFVHGGEAGSNREVNRTDPHSGKQHWRDSYWRKNEVYFGRLNIHGKNVCV